MYSALSFAPGDKVIRFGLIAGSRVRGTVLRVNRYAQTLTVRELIRKPAGQRIIWDVPAYLLDDLATSTL